MLSGELLSTLKTVLENLPPAKPSGWSLAVQLCAPVSLAVKALYDMYSVVSAMISNGKGTEGQYVAVVVSLFFIVMTAIVSGIMWKGFRDAHAKKDPHHARMLREVRHQCTMHGLDYEDDSGGGTSDGATMAS